METSTFLNDNNWCGSYYELCILVGPTGDDERLARVLAALWSGASFQGPWRNPNSLSSEADRPGEGDLSDHLYGVIALESGCELGCVSCVVREEEGDDWVDLCFPSAMLETAFPLVYPIVVSLNPWLKALETFFVELGSSVFRRAPFSLAVIGEEVSGFVSPSTLTREFCRNNVLLVPEALLESCGLHDVPHRRVEEGLVVTGIEP